jgi:pimeloyl-ACP methyl ester carboxylesterase
MLCLGKTPGQDGLTALLLLVPSGRLVEVDPEEQADDAAGLLAALVRGPAVVCGTSSGAVFALRLLARHPAAMRGAILHEPALFAFLDDLDAVRAPLRARIGSAMETGGPKAATEPWWRYVAGDDAWDKLAPDPRERMRASSETAFGVELGSYERYLPDDATLAAVTPSVRLLVSADGLAPYTEAARRLGQRLGADVETTPGTHTAYHDHPIEFAQAIRRLQRELTAIRAIAPRRPPSRIPMHATTSRAEKARPGRRAPDTTQEAARRHRDFRVEAQRAAQRVPQPDGSWHGVRLLARDVLTAAPPLADPLVVIVLRLLYTAAVMVVVIWLLRTGNPVGGLLLVPAAAVWLRREAESGRLAARVRRAPRP